MKELKKNTSLSFEEFSKLVNSIILTENGNCPVTPVISMLQGKWKMQIIYELKKMLGNVTNTALTNALRELEENELIHREQFNEIPPHVEYSLTDKGKDLLPVFHAIANWGLKYIS